MSAAESGDEPGVRCPQCQAANARGVLHCAACGQRLFAWLGDPFGAAERPALVTPGGAEPEAAVTSAVVVAPPPMPPGGVPETPAAASRQTNSGAGWGKVAVLLLVLPLLAVWASLSPGWALGGLLIVVGLLVRWPRLGCLAYGGLTLLLLLLLLFVQVTLGGWG